MLDIAVSDPEVARLFSSIFNQQLIRRGSEVSALYRLLEFFRMNGQSCSRVKAHLGGILILTDIRGLVSTVYVQTIFYTQEVKLSLSQNLKIDNETSIFEEMSDRSLPEIDKIAIS